MKNTARLLSLLLALGITGTAVAQPTMGPTAEGFSINRYQPATMGSDWFALESLDLQGHGRFAGGLVIDYARKPLVIYDAAGNEVVAPIKDHMQLHLGLAVNLWGRLRLSANLPIALVADGTSGSARGFVFAAKDSAAVGDLRLGADLRLLGNYGDVFTLALGAQVHLPTGSRDAYTSDGKARFVPRLMMAGDILAFTYAALVGLDGRLLQDNFGGRPFGTELTFAASAGVRLADRALLIGPELYGSTVVTDDAVFKKRSTPTELIFGANYRAGDSWMLGLGAGPGLNRSLGTPSYRLLARIAYFPKHNSPPPPPPPDRDGDGILDADDACPDTKGVRSADRRFNGCPDRDKDGIFDKVDACPDDPGPASDDPAKNGCPDRDKDGILDKADACPDEPGIASEDRDFHGCPDRDKDGIFDKVDACPDEPGVKSDDPKKNGCPLPPDRDGDKIIDAEDACPDVAGDPDPDPKKNGCPKVQIKEKEIVILERIEFDTAKATLRPESMPVLNAILRVFKEHPEITKVRVEGHTDSRGNAKYNKKLSQSRVETVVRWLVDNGIEEGRLTPVGYGKDRPIASNRTNEGRQRNRRVQFIITEREGKPVEGSTP